MASICRYYHRRLLYSYPRLFVAIPAFVFVGLVCYHMSDFPVAQDAEFSVKSRDMPPRPDLSLDCDGIQGCSYQDNQISINKKTSKKNNPDIGDSRNGGKTEEDDPVSERHLRVKERCHERNLGRASNREPVLPKFPMDPIISNTHDPNIFFCPLAKAGSTYFTRYIIAVNKEEESMLSPFDIRIEDAGRDKVSGFNSLRLPDAKRHFLKNSFKFLFTRDPWGRVFSSYIDKLYSPNPYFWKTWGQDAVRVLHLNPTDHQCGEGVSFSDFVKLVIRKLHKTDMHFIPMMDMCRVCDVSWDMVGKLEKGSRDIGYLSHQINVSSEFLHRESYEKASVLDVIHDSTLNALGDWKNDIQKCIGMYDAGRIIWRRLQIRGVIYDDIKFPFTPQNMNIVSAKQFKEKCIEAAERSTDKKRLKLQKLKAFQEAYSTVSKADLQSLKNIFKNDLYVLGYDPQPFTVFESSLNVDSIRNSSILDWRRV